MEVGHWYFSSLQCNAQTQKSHLNSGIGLSGKLKSHYSLCNVLPRGGAWNRAIWPIAEMLANALTANRGEC